MFNRVALKEKAATHSWSLRIPFFPFWTPHLLYHSAKRSSVGRNSLRAPEGAWTMTCIRHSTELWSLTGRETQGQPAFVSQKPRRGESSVGTGRGWFSQSPAGAKAR